MSFKIYDEICRQLDPDLPEGWAVYSAESLPKGSHLKPKDRTHLELKGSVPRTTKTGRKIWSPRLYPKEFIVSFQDIARASAGISENHDEQLENYTQATQGSLFHE